MFEDELEVLAEDENEAESSSAPAAPATPVAAAPVAVAAPRRLVVEDVPLKATDILLIIIAQKSRKQVNEVPVSKTIQDLVGGKSTMQNENRGSPTLVLVCSLEGCGAAAGGAWLCPWRWFLRHLGQVQLCTSHLPYSSSHRGDGEGRYFEVPRR